MIEYSRTHETDTHRVRWIYDESYETVGSYAYDTEAETKAAEDWELERLRDGRLITLGAIVETKCGACGQWETRDSLWGIVVSPDENLKAYGDHSLDIPLSGSAVGV